MTDHSPQAVIERTDFDSLLDALRRQGYQLIGPRVRDGVIVYDEIASAADLPAGYTETQDKASYRLERREDAALFGYADGPHSWKQFLYPSARRLMRAQRTDGTFRVRPDEAVPPRLALIGVRACDLNAIAIQDRVFIRGPYPDPYYQQAREQAFIVAVNCTEPGGTCFCVSMNTGPQAASGFDLALTEILDGQQHLFTVEIGSDKGRALLAEVRHRKATEADQRAAAKAIAAAAKNMGRSLKTAGLRALLVNNAEHPRWDDVAKRCLTCANCTMVCPTCFCTTVEDVTDIAGGTAERWRKWDSCFTLDFSYIYGGSVRASAKARYRQWLTHKLATWVDQFGVMGCVGCGRCITWCPVGIDITEEAAAIREDGATRRKQHA